MIYRLLIPVSIFVVCFPAEVTYGNYTAESSDPTIRQGVPCPVTVNVKANLDLAIQLITNVRDNYHVCKYAICSSEPLPIDCEEVLHRGHTNSGVYMILPRSRVVSNPIEVYCDMWTDGGGWTVIQRRGNFSRTVDYFFQNWKEYKKGFGNVDGEFWLGNDNIFGLTNQGLYSVRFDLRDMTGNETYALYDEFWIDDEDHKYTLHIDGYSGFAGDSMIEIHNGQKISTKDQKNDNLPAANNSCALMYKGGWWYNKCHTANLNGLNLRSKHASYADGINWYTWRNYHDSLDWTEIKIRRKRVQQVEPPQFNP